MVTYKGNLVSFFKSLEGRPCYLFKPRAMPSTREVGHTLSMTSLAIDILDIVKEDYFRTDLSTLLRELGCGAPHL